jgi:hypothetical protein
MTVDAREFDLVSKRWARSRPSRRWILGSGGFGLAALAAAVLTPGRMGVSAAPARQATPAATPAGSYPDAIAIDDTWFCNQTYALCNTAVCERSADDPSVANCPCVVLNGYSMGFKTCEERAQHGTSLFSTFSTANVNSEFGILSCPGDAAWVNCLDYPCEMDPRDPALATCQCAVVEKGPFRTFGGYCDESVCTTELLSGTSLEAPGVAQYMTGMQQVQLPVTLPETCPGATEAATPTA